MARAQGSDNGGCQRNGPKRRPFSSYPFRSDHFDSVLRLDEEMWRQGRRPLLSWSGPPEDRTARLYLGRDLLKRLTAWDRIQAVVLVVWWHMAEHGDIARLIRFPKPENRWLERRARDAAIADRVRAHRELGSTRADAVLAVAAEDETASDPIRKRIAILRGRLRQPTTAADRATIEDRVRRLETRLKSGRFLSEETILHALKRDARRRRGEAAFDRWQEEELVQMRAEAEAARLRSEAEAAGG